MLLSIFINGFSKSKQYNARKAIEKMILNEDDNKRENSAILRQKTALKDNAKKSI